MTMTKVLFRFEGYQDDAKGGHFPLFTCLKEELFYVSGAVFKKFVPETTVGPNMLAKFGYVLPSEFGDLDPQKGEVFDFNV